MQRLLGAVLRRLAPLALTVCVAAIALLAAAPAHAQVSVRNASEQPLIGGDRHPKAADVTPAPALPGAVSNPDEVAKATNIDLQPTQSLFDAVNRGDIATAREAIGRGADLQAKNVLGLTPLDLSVDLGRNDITFLLLSLRGSAPPPATLAATAKALPNPALSTKGHAPARAVALRVAAPARKVERVAQTQPADAPLRRYVSTDPGTPVPQAGFLGFAGH